MRAGGATLREAPTGPLCATSAVPAYGFARTAGPAAGYCALALLCDNWETVR